MPRITPEPKPLLMPSSVAGCVVVTCAALGCSQCSRPVAHRPVALINSPALTAAAWPAKATRSRCPRALARSTQKPFSASWQVTRSHQPGQRLHRRCRPAPGRLALVRDPCRSDEAARDPAGGDRTHGDGAALSHRGIGHAQTKTPAPLRGAGARLASMRRRHSRFAGGVRRPWFGTPGTRASSQTEPGSRRSSLRGGTSGRSASRVPGG